MLEVANSSVAASSPAVAAAAADDDGNCPRSYGTDVPVQVRRECTDGPCRVHGGLCALSEAMRCLSSSCSSSSTSAFSSSSSLLSIPLPPSLSLSLSPPPFVSPLLHFFPSRALLRSRVLFYLLFSPRLIFAKASSRLAGVRGPKFRSPPPWVSIFKGSHLFSSFCLLFLRFLHRPASPGCPLSSASVLSLLRYPFYPHYRNLAHTDSFLSSTG